MKECSYCDSFKLVHRGWRKINKYTSKILWQYDRPHHKFKFQSMYTRKNKNATVFYKLDNFFEFNEL